MKKAVSEDRRQKRVTIQIAKPFAKEFKKRVKKYVAGAKIIGSKVIGKNVSFAIEFDRVIDADVLNIGFHINEQKFIAAAAVDAKKAKEKLESEGKQSPTLTLKFDRSITREMMAKYKTELKIISQTADITGKQSEFVFDISDVHSTKDLADRMISIMSVVRTIQENRRLKRDAEFLELCLKDMNTFGQMTKNSYIYTEMTGKELIETNECTVFNSNSKTANIFQKLINVVFGKSNKKLDYYYFDQLVLPKNNYIVKHAPKPCKDGAEIVNHAKELDMAYRYGEQLYLGGGVDEVEQYYKSICRIYEKKATEHYQALKEAESKEN